MQLYTKKLNVLACVQHIFSTQYIDQQFQYR